MKNELNKLGADGIKAGTIRYIGELHVISDRFKKIEVVLEVQDGNYINTIPFEFQRQRTELITKSQFKAGDAVEIYYKLKGREVIKDDQKKYYNCLEALKIVKQGE